MTLSRKGFFSGLLAMASAIIAKAQTSSGPGATIITPCRPKIQWGNQLLLCNGQCPNPECSYRAPVFYRKDYSWHVTQNGIPVPPDQVATRKAEWDELFAAGEVYWEPFRQADGTFVPSKRLNRCPNCNTAFWQDPQP